MTFLTQDGLQLVEVNFVDIQNEENDFHLIGFSESIHPIILGTFDSEEKAKSVLHHFVITGSKIIPKN